MHDERDKVNDRGLQDAAESCGYRFAKNQGAAPCRTYQQFMHHAEVAFPDHCNAIEDRAEQHALREDAGRDEREVA